MNLILLLTTPVVGLGMLLGIDRFEKWALEERPSAGAPTDPLEAVAEAVVEVVPEVAGPGLRPQPVQRAAA